MPVACDIDIPKRPPTISIYALRYLVAHRHACCRGQTFLRRTAVAPAQPAVFARLPTMAIALDTLQIMTFPLGIGLEYLTSPTYPSRLEIFPFSKKANLIERPLLSNLLKKIFRDQNLFRDNRDLEKISGSAFFENDSF